MQPATKPDLSQPSDAVEPTTQAGSLLSWFELSTLKPGARIAFAEARVERTMFSSIDIPAGTVCIITEQGLNEIWGGIIVAPVSRALQQELVHHQAGYDGGIFLDGPTDSTPSPFLLDDSCPVECI